MRRFRRACVLSVAALLALVVGCSASHECAPSTCIDAGTAPTSCASAFDAFYAMRWDGHRNTTIPCSGFDRCWGCPVLLTCTDGTLRVDVSSAPCDAGPGADSGWRADGGASEDADARLDGDPPGGEAGSSGAPDATLDAADGGTFDLDGTSPPPVHNCGIWFCTSSQRCIQTCNGNDAGDYNVQCVDVPTGCAHSDCPCIAAHDPCVACSGPVVACDSCHGRP